jgi:hypothetical protein
MKTVTLSFVASPTDVDQPLGLLVSVNQKEIFDTEQLTAAKRVVITVDEADDAEYCVQITLKNKTTDHTKINSDGSIMSDSMINISNVEFSDVEIDQLFLKKSKYTHSFNSSQAESVNDFYGNMGCNGTVSFEFTTPSYIWILESM